MKQILILIFIIFAISFTNAQDTVRVLFIGNSHTFVNDLPTIFNELCNEANKTVLVSSATMGGATLQNHYNSSQTISKIQQDDWDYVILQEQSQIPSRDTLRDSLMYPFAILLDSIIHKNNVCTKTIFFMTWAHKPGDLEIIQNGGSDTFENMQQRLRNGYKIIADSLNAMICPAGWAWREVRQIDSTIELYLSDQYHPALNGTYLTACAFYSTIFQETSYQIPYFSTIAQNTAEFLQATASSIVLDSLNAWNINVYGSKPIADFSYNTINSTVNFVDSSYLANSYYWDFGDGNNSSLKNTSHQYLSNGNYNVMHIAFNNCSDTLNSDTIFNQINIQTTNIVNTTESNINIYPNPTTGKITIEGNNIQKVEIIDLKGELVFSSNYKTVKNNLVKVSDIKKGVYIVKITRNSDVITKKILIK